MNPWVIGGALFVIGFVLGYLAGRRRWNHRTHWTPPWDVERFPRGEGRWSDHGPGWGG